MNMKHTQRSYRRLFLLLFLLGAFVLFSMPTMMIGDKETVSSRPHLVHDLPNSMKAVKRVAPSPASKLLLMAALLAVLFRWISFPRFYSKTPECALLSAIFLQRLRSLLMPLKLTTSYSRV
ncbi:hypothetical protein [Paenibacillus protaetiae]|uniref:Uncharacterized protein n=1 Tax=Paenibacillus protaetiae TaxID=2509456 RepID=A0A4P6ES25_9BACL|nr:hypothetical protein [Paenibacillus protaetiae]QAY65890.1 hypothetical protein ET464_05330 [Paenibacillus protaetiae]